MSDGSKIKKNNIAVGLLQSERRIDSGSRATSAALGAEEGENPCPARGSKRMRARGTIAREGFQQSVGSGGLIDILARAGAHAGNNAGRLGHFAIGEDADLKSGRLDQFDSAN